MSSNLMNPKHGDWDRLGNTHKFDNTHKLNFLVHMVKIFKDFNIEKTEKETNFNFQGKTNVFCITKHSALKIRHTKCNIISEYRSLV